MDKVSGVYQILNVFNAKKYNGSSKNIYNRWRRHRNLLKRNGHTNRYLQKDWNDFGEESFKFIILEECESTREALEEREQHWINHCRSYIREYGYNILPYANNSSCLAPQIFSGEMIYNAKLTFEQADEIRKRYKEENVNSQMLAEEYNSNRSTICKILNYQSYIRPEDRDKVFEPIKKKKLFSPKARENLSKSHMGNEGYWEGKKRSPETVEKMRLANLGRKQSEKEKEKRANSLRGQKRSEKYKKMMSERFSGENAPTSKLSLKEVDEIRKEYVENKNITQNQLGEKYGVSRSCILAIVSNVTWYDENYIYVKRR